MLVGAALGLDLTGLIAAARAARSPRPRRRGSRISRAVASPASRSRASSATRNSGGCRCGSRPPRWCRGPTPRRWSNWRWKSPGRAAPAIRTRRLRIADIGTGSGAMLLALLSELPHAYGVGTDISVAALRTAAANAARSRTGRSRRVRRLRLCGGAGGHLRSDRVQPALYPLRRDRRPRRRGARSRPAWRARRRRRTDSTPTAR